MALRADREEVVYQQGVRAGAWAVITRLAILDAGTGKYRAAIEELQRENGFDGCARSMNEGTDYWRAERAEKLLRELGVTP